MADNIQAGAQTGTGPKFAGDTDGAGLSWPFSKLVFGALHSAYTIVSDAVGSRFPVKSTPDGVSVTDASTTIGTGGTSQAALTQNLSRKGGVVGNPSGAIESLFVDFGATAASGSAGHSIELMPGQSFNLHQDGIVITDAINVVAATAGHAFLCKSFA